MKSCGRKWLGGRPILSSVPSSRRARGTRVEQSSDRVVFRMEECRVQLARGRRGLPDFPCKSVALVEYEGFAKTVDPRIRTRCIVCPPDEHPEEYWCAWEFSLPEDPSRKEN